jgi:hypothetical protein
MNKPLRPRALVTGASSGIGAELARELARDGHDLVLIARRREALERLADEFTRGHGVAVHCEACDLCDASAIEALIARLDANALHIDVLVNNAGFGLFGEFKDTDLAEERRMLALNIEAPVILTKRLLAQLIARRGRILNVASTAAFQPGPFMAVYYATKAFLLSWSEALAEELAGTGVTVTAFCPGATASGFQDRAAMHDSALVRGKRLPSAAEVAAAGYRALKAGRRVFIPGLMNWLLAQSIRFTPRRLVTPIVRYMAGPARGTR